MVGNPLPAAFFAADAETVARALLGRHVVRRNEEGAYKYYVIEETEAYLGPHDLACHSARGRTRRTETMFGPPGTLYVYLVYGLHLLLNVVVGPPRSGAAVLIRSAGGVTGPGRLGRVLGLGLDLNGRFARPDTGLWFAGEPDMKPRVIATPRIGVDYAGPDWARRPLRFVRAEA